MGQDGSFVVCFVHHMFNITLWADRRTCSKYVMRGIFLCIICLETQLQL